MTFPYVLVLCPFHVMFSAFPFALSFFGILLPFVFLPLFYVLSNSLVLSISFQSFSFPSISFPCPFHFLPSPPYRPFHVNSISIPCPFHFNSVSIPFQLRIHSMSIPFQFHSFLPICFPLSSVYVLSICWLFPLNTCFFFFFFFFLCPASCFHSTFANERSLKEILLESNNCCCFP